MKDNLLSTSLDDITQSPRKVRTARGPVTHVTLRVDRANTACVPMLDIHRKQWSCANPLHRNPKNNYWQREEEGRPSSPTNGPFNCHFIPRSPNQLKSRQALWFLCEILLMFNYTNIYHSLYVGTEAGISPEQTVLPRPSQSVAWPSWRDNRVPAHQRALHQTRTSAWNRFVFSRNRSCSLNICLFRDPIWRVGYEKQVREQPADQTDCSQAGQPPTQAASPANKRTGLT